MENDDEDEDEDEDKGEKFGQSTEWKLNNKTLHPANENIERARGHGDDDDALLYLIFFIFSLFLCSFWAFFMVVLDTSSISTRWRSSSFGWWLTMTHVCPPRERAKMREKPKSQGQ